MGIQKAGGTNVFQTISAPANASALVTALVTHLVTAGWSVSGSGDARTFTSAQTPNGSYGCRVITSVASSRLRLKWDTYAGGAPQTNYFGICQPDGVSDWKLLANRFGFCLREASSIGSTQNKFVWCSLLYVDSDIAGDSACQFFGFMDSRSDGLAGTGDLRTRPYKDSVYFGALMVKNNTVGEIYGSTDTAAKGGPRWDGIPAERTLLLNLNVNFDETWFNGDPVAQNLAVAFGHPDWTTGSPQKQGIAFDNIAIIGQARSDGAEFTYQGDTFITWGSIAGGLDWPAVTLGWLKPA